MKKLIILPALVVLGTTGNPAVAETGLYGGLGVGGSKIESDVSTTFPTSAPPPQDNNFVVDFDEYDASFKAFAGYRFLDWLAVEGGWYYIGKPDGSRSAVDPSTRIDTEIELKGWNADLVAFWRFQEQWELFGKVGVFIWNSETTYRSKVDASGSPSGNPPGFDQIFFDDKSGEDVKGAVGINYLHDDNLALRAEFEYFFIDEELGATASDAPGLDPNFFEEGDTNAVWMLSFSAIWRFK